MSLAQEAIDSILAARGANEKGDDDKGNGNGKPDAKTIIKALIDTKFSGSNEEQGKAVQLLRGLAFSDDPVSNKFMKKLDDYTSNLNVDDFSEGAIREVNAGGVEVVYKGDIDSTLAKSTALAGDIAVPVRKAMAKYKFKVERITVEF